MEKSYLASIKTNVTVPDLTFKNRELLREFKRYIRTTHTNAVRDGEDILRDVILKENLFATGRLFRSVTSALFVKSDEIFTGRVGFSKPGSEYAYFVEHGRGPNLGYSEDNESEGSGYSGLLANLKRWGRAKGLSSAHIYFIYKKIKRDGTKPHPFMERAEREIDAAYSRTMNRAIQLYKKGVK